MDLQEISVYLFIALGGVGLILSLVLKYLPQAVDKAGDWILRFPKARAFVKANAKKLKEIVQACEDEIEKDIDATEAE